MLALSALGPVIITMKNGLMARGLCVWVCLCMFVYVFHLTTPPASERELAEGKWETISDKLPRCLGLSLASTRGSAGRSHRALAFG